MLGINFCSTNALTMSSHMLTLDYAIEQLQSDTDIYTFYRNYIVLVQSSGYGKTRSCIELLKTTPGIYLLCADAGLMCQSKCIKTLLEVLKHLGTSNNSQKTKIILSFLSGLQKIIFGPQRETLFSYQFDVINSTYKDPIVYEELQVTPTKSKWSKLDNVVTFVERNTATPSNMSNSDDYEDKNISTSIDPVGFKKSKRTAVTFSDEYYKIDNEDYKD